MNKLTSLIVLVLVLCLSFSCFASESFEYDNIIYTIELVSSIGGDEISLVLTAVDYVDPSLTSEPPASLEANIIYDLLDYDNDSKPATELSEALADMDEAPLEIIKSPSLGGDVLPSEGGQTDENGVFVSAESEETTNETTSETQEPVSAPSAPAIKVIIHDIYTETESTVSFPDQNPVLVNDRTLIPARGVFEELGYLVSWNEQTSEATVSGDGITVRIPINSSVIYKNDQEITLDVPAQLIGGRTMLPLRAISTALGLEVEWVESTNSVIIYY